MESLSPSGKEAVMTRIWSRPIGVPDLDGQDYWEYFGDRLVEHAEIYPGAKVLDIACGTGSSLFPAAKKTGPLGYVTGFDICPG
jgi:ubiquinone/menaquinone biosynthesis C-methylase UbiE